MNKTKQNHVARIAITDPLAEHGLMIENALRLAGYEVKLTLDSRQAADLCRSLGANAALRESGKPRDLVIAVEEMLL